MATFLERRITRLSVAIQLVDEFTGGPPIGDVSASLLESDAVPRLNAEGYLLFLDLPDGNYTLQVSAAYYDITAVLNFNVADQDPLNTALTLVLRPNAAYPFPNTTTILRGTVLDSSGQPVADVDAVTGTGLAARTNAEGRYVFYFDVSIAELVNVTLTKFGYLTLDESTTVFPRQTVLLGSTLVLENDPNIANLVLTLTDSFGDPVTQALVEAPAYGASDQTDLAGQARLSIMTAQQSESVAVRANQQGFAEGNLNVNLTRGQTENAALLLNTDFNNQTARLRVRTELDDDRTSGVLVEVLEKGRSALSSSNDERARFYFTDLASKKEDVTVRCSMPGFVTETVTVEIEKNKERNKTIDLDPV